MILCRDDKEVEVAESASSLMSANGPAPLSVLLICGGGRGSRTGGEFMVCTRVAGG